MNQLHAQLTHNEWTLLVSLPRNDVELARAALRGGARGLKVHINVEHFASGTRFGSWDEEREVLAQIVAIARHEGASVGVVPGASGAFASPADFRGLAEIGIDYFDAYPFDCPAWALGQTDLDVMMAAFHGYDGAEFAGLQELGMTLCEASILGHEDYGKALTARDVARYAQLVKSLRVPVIVPSQKKIEPGDVAALRASGARGLLIGAIVTGREAEGIEAAARSFAD